MNVDAYIASGILEHYCLGFCSEEEQAVIEQYAAMYPAISKEIEKIRSSLEDHFKANEIMPSPSVKIKLMRAIYRQIAAGDATYPPLIDKEQGPADIAAWLSGMEIPRPDAAFKNLSVINLPSTVEVINFFAYAKIGQEEEVHDDLIEYLYVVRGSCIMDLNGEKVPYGKGEMISIMPKIRHLAVITSEEPMIALVQRQVFV